MLKNLTRNTALILMIYAPITLGSILEQAREFAVSELEREYIGRVEVTFSNRNKMMKNKHCEDIPEFKLNNIHRLTSRGVVEVSCPAPEFSFRLPINIAIYRDVVVANRPIPRKKIITSNDLYLSEQDITKIPQGFYEDISEVQDMEVSYGIRPGMPIARKNITEPKIIKRGDIVSIIAKSDGVSVRMNGIAEQNGSLGETIKVKNMSSSRLVDAKVISSGTTEIYFL